MSLETLWTSDGLSVIIWRDPGVVRQHRFPRSKSRRIRKKWAKREENRRWFPTYRGPFRVGPHLYVNAADYQRIAEERARIEAVRDAWRRDRMWR